MFTSHMPNSHCLRLYRPTFNENNIKNNSIWNWHWISHKIHKHICIHQTTSFAMCFAKIDDIPHIVLALCSRLAKRLSVWNAIVLFLLFKILKWLSSLSFFSPPLFVLKLLAYAENISCAKTFRYYANLEHTHTIKSAELFLITYFSNIQVDWPAFV